MELSDGKYSYNTLKTHGHRGNKVQVPILGGGVSMWGGVWRDGVGCGGMIMAFYWDDYGMLLV